jgi:hypothetical protein
VERARAVRSLSLSPSAAPRPLPPLQNQEIGRDPRRVDVDTPRAVKDLLILLRERVFRPVLFLFPLAAAWGVVTAIRFGVLKATRRSRTTGVRA